MAKEVQSRKVGLKDARTIIEQAFRVKRPVFVWGPPGVGKSDIIQQIGVGDIGNEKNEVRPVVDMRLLLCEPTDIKGIPYYNPDTKTMRWAPPGDLPQTGDESMENAILFLDEMNAAPPSVQAAAYQLILNRRVGEYKLPDGVDIVAAGNRETDKGVTYRMPSPLANRFVHIEVQPLFDDWQEWAIVNGVHPDVVGFLTGMKQNLFNFDPKSSDKAFPTPRSWHFVSQFLNDKKNTLSQDLLTTVVAGCVGEGAALEFMTHRSVVGRLPKPEDILAGKEKTLKGIDKDREISAQYALAISLCYTMKEYYEQAEKNKARKNTEKGAFQEDDYFEAFNNFLQFMMDNFKKELVILGARVALATYKLPVSDKKIKCFDKFYKDFHKHVIPSKGDE